MSEGSGKKFGSDKITIVLVVLVVALAFGMGVIWNKVKLLEGKGATTGAESTKTGQEAAQQQQPQTKVTLDQIKGLFSKDLIKFGKANSKLLFVEISDPSCPYCQIAAGKNPELNNQAGDRFKMVADGGTYLPPVVEIKKLVDQGKAAMVWIYQNGHGAGEMAAKALYCANEKGKYWEAHDLLMSAKGYDLINNTIKNDKTKSGELAEFLATAMSSSDMKNCLDSGKYDARLTSDQALAVSLGVQGTPGFFVNETNFAGAYSFTDMKTVVDAVLK
jgi:protein-disulfide isomerase